MSMLYGPISRIILRYLVGALVAYNVITADHGSIVSTDPDLATLLEVGLSAVPGVAMEVWYWMAKRFGWPT
jgi:hypothetical protein